MVFDRRFILGWIHVAVSALQRSNFDVLSQSERALRGLIMIIIQRINLINIDIVEFILVIKLVHVVCSAIYLHLPRLRDAA